MTAVDISNLALSPLGDSATVTAIDPPDGSPQAELCARYYPLARDSLLSRHSWSFAYGTAELDAVIYETDPAWSYAFDLPSDALYIDSVYCTDDPSVTVEFSLSTMPDGRVVIGTNTDAVSCRYRIMAIDPDVLPPDCVLALAYGMASLLAGPILRGKDGLAVGQEMLKQNAFYLARAAASDANQRTATDTYQPVWITSR